MAKDIAIALAWPETLCKQPGAWYDPLMNIIGVSKNGYYKVGHAAVVLIKRETGECIYFDFGRYHAPNGFGRVRDLETDHDLSIQTKIEFDENDCPINSVKLMEELEYKNACHGKGSLLAGSFHVDFDQSYLYAKGLQKQEFVPYGPFVIDGSNCSRFVQDTILNGMKLSIRKIALGLPLMMTPTPKWNVSTSKLIYNGFLTEKTKCYESEIA